MAAPPPPNPPPVPLPEQPNDPTVHLPSAPVFPPTESDVIRAVAYRQNVDASFRTRPIDMRCTHKDQYNSILYEHNVITQAAAVANPQAMTPPWLQGTTIQQLCANIQNDIRQEFVPDLKRLMNHNRGNGNVVPFEVIPFTDGSDPTLPPHNLPPLHSINVIRNLDEQTLATYLTHYGVVPLPSVVGDPLATNEFQKDRLRIFVGGAWPWF
ncbi:hypothetical protein BJY52DRAFT_366245 [Lactarius psammicola]|nr:hypothetical protein BJY52DRAFT_366245 [Lactarius psammicola]